MGLGESEVPKFTVIVAQKRHHTRLFEAGGSGNVPPGMMCFCLLNFVLQSQMIVILSFRPPTFLLPLSCHRDGCGH